VSATTLGRATTAARSVGRSMQESGDITRAREKLAAIDEQRRALEDDIAAETAAIEAAGDPATEVFERVTVKAKRTNVALKLVALVWTC
jgi:hypothetical protein